MCLYIDSYRSEEAVLRIRKANKPVYAYKVMTLVRNGSGIEFCGMYQSTFKYKDGLNVSDRQSTIVTIEEKTSCSVASGFHCYMRLKEAMLSEGSDKTYRFYRVKIEPKDVVAVGTFGGCKSIVCTKFTVDLNKPSKTSIS